MNQGGAAWNWLGGITTVVLVGVVLGNAANLANVLNGIAGLYSAAAGAAKNQPGGKQTG